MKYYSRKLADTGKRTLITIQELHYGTAHIDDII